MKIQYLENPGICLLEEPLYSEPPAEEAVCLPEEMTPVIPDTISFANLSRQAFPQSSRNFVVPTHWQNPAPYTPVGAIFSVAACNGDDHKPVATGDPIDHIEALGSETAIGSTPGTVEGASLSSSGNQSAAAWSIFHSTSATPRQTLAYLRTGASGGNLFTVASGDGTAKHIGTTSTILDNGETLVVWTLASGATDPSSIVAQRVSAGGSPVGSPITILIPDERSLEGLAAQVVATSSGFVAVYPDGSNLVAQAFDNNGSPRGITTLANSMLNGRPRPFRITRGEGDEWAFAEVISGFQIRVRTFNGTSPTGVSATVGDSSLTPEPNLGIAMQPDGSMMLAYNTTSGIRGAVLDGGGGVAVAPFSIESGASAQTLTLTSDHHNNFVLAWEQSETIRARIYHGDTNYDNLPGSSISPGPGNGNIQATVTDDSILSFVYVRPRLEGGNTFQDILRRDYQITYQ